MKDAAYTGQAQTVSEYIQEAIVSPDVFISGGCSGGACQKGMMPAALAKALDGQELTAVVQYLTKLTSAPKSAASAAPTAVPAPAATDPQAIAAAFQKGTCGACHVIPGVAGAAGAIGPDLSKMGETAQAT